MVTSIPIEPLTAQAFKDFGDVIEANEGDGFGINQGYTWRHHKLATVETVSYTHLTLPTNREV